MKMLLPALLTIATPLCLLGCAQSNIYNQLALTPKPLMTDSSVDPQSLGIAFGGGGLRGYMHLGAIKALTEHNITADFVTGTSVGSVAATLYASGMEYEKLEDIVTSLNGPCLLDVVISSQGFINGKALANWINDAISQEQLSEMAIPIGITATNMTSYESVLIRDGNPGESVQTSSTIPGIFHPVHHHDHVLADGGVLSVVPIDFVKSMGADIVIGIDIYCGNQPEVQTGAFAMQLATFRYLSCSLSEEEIKRADILIQPDFEPEMTFSEDARHLSIKAGYDAMMEKIPELQALLKSRT